MVGAKLSTRNVLTWIEVEKKRSIDFVYLKSVSWATTTRFDHLNSPTTPNVFTATQHCPRMAHNDRFCDPAVHLVPAVQPPILTWCRHQPHSRVWPQVRRECGPRGETLAAIPRRSIADVVRKLQQRTGQAHPGLRLSLQHLGSFSPNVLLSLRP